MKHDVFLEQGVVMEEAATWTEVWSGGLSPFPALQSSGFGEASDFGITTS
jgi:hypothetical protein